MTTYKPSNTEMQHISQLMALHGAAFVTAAYRSVLGRNPDPHGAAYFLTRVETDHNKAAILYELATSAEGLARRQSLGGLSELVSSRGPAHSRLRRWLNKFSRVEQTSMRIEWALAASGQQTEERLLMLDSKLAQLVQGRQQLDAHLESRFQGLETRLTQALASLQQLHENLGAGLANHGRLNAEGMNSLAERLTERLTEQMAASQRTQDLIVERLRACEDLLIPGTQGPGTGPVVDATQPAAAAAGQTAPKALDCKLDASQGAPSLIHRLASQLANSAEAASLSAR